MISGKLRIPVVQDIATTAVPVHTGVGLCHRNYVLPREIADSAGLAAGLGATATAPPVPVVCHG